MRARIPHVPLALCAILIIAIMVMAKAMTPAVKRIIEDGSYAALWVAK
jgi:hypothetical protein